MVWGVGGVGGRGWGGEGERSGTFAACNVWLEAVSECGVLEGYDPEREWVACTVRLFGTGGSCASALASYASKTNKTFRGYSVCVWVSAMAHRL